MCWFRCHPIAAICVAATAGLFSAIGGAAAQELPPGEVRLVAAFPAGSGSDVWCGGSPKSSSP